MLLADLLADGDDNALPSHHRSQAECHRYGDFYPGGNETGGEVDVLLVVGQYRGIGCRKLRLAGLGRDSEDLAHQVEIVAEVADAIIGNIPKFLVESGLV